MPVESLYTKILVESCRAETHTGKPEDPEQWRSKKGANPVCGDEITWYVKLDKNRIAAVRYEVKGCMISKASAALLADMVSGKTIEEFRRTLTELEALVSPSGTPPGETRITEQKWTALAQVQAYPARRKCAMLAWHTLDEVLG